jgi:DNA repair protein RecN (Recombination protein N)
MLTGLAIRDIVLIDRLSLEFRDGLTVLTGETGAGKSILLDALGLALGRRAEGAMVRRGRSEGAVVASFELEAKHPARALLAAQGLPDAAELVLRRVVTADGKSRAFANDEPISVGLMRALGELLIESQDQGEEQGLASHARQRELLDSFGGLTEATEAAAAFRLWQDRIATCRALAERWARLKTEEDYLRHVAEELAALNPRLGEEAELAAERLLLRDGEKLAESLNEAKTAFAEDGIERRLKIALRALERMAPRAQGKLDAPIAALDRALTEAAEANASLERASSAFDFSGERLNTVEERLFALRGAARKHNVPVDRLAELASEFAARLAAIERHDAELGQAQAALEKARADYVVAAKALSAARSEAASRLEKAVSRELKPLKFENARFRVGLEPLAEADWGAQGIDRVGFQISTNPNEPLGPLSRIASGGERARLMLALKVALAGQGDAGTLIFDEVDRGVGGATAAAVGERLKRLAQNVQILVVTHSPQVAACGRHHWLVRKIEQGNGENRISVIKADRLMARERTEEIARMLAGQRITQAARAAASSLLEQDRPLS